MKGKTTYIPNVRNTLKYTKIIFMGSQAVLVVFTTSQVFTFRPIQEM